MSAIGLTRDGNHRYAWMGDEKVPGITTVIKMLDKSDVLAGWAKRETAKAAIRNLDTLTRMVAEGGTLNAVNWLKGMPGYQRDTAADIGTAVHGIAERIALGETPDVPDELVPFVRSYARGFLERYQPRFHPDYTEYMVYSEEWRYGGTMDAAVRIDGDVWLIDYKTGGDKSIGLAERDFPYPETALQLAGGRYADFMGRPGDPERHPLPPVTRCGVVAITRDDAQLIEYDVTPQEFEVFLALRRAYDFKNKRAAEVKVGVPQREVAA